MKNLKTIYNSQTLKEIIQLPLPHKNFLLLRKKNYLRDLQEYTDLLFPSALRMQFLEVCVVSNVLAVLLEYVFYNIEQDSTKKSRFLSKTVL